MVKDYPKSMELAQDPLRSLRDWHFLRCKCNSPLINPFALFCAGYLTRRRFLLAVDALLSLSSHHTSARLAWWTRGDLKWWGFLVSILFYELDEKLYSFVRTFGRGEMFRRPRACDLRFTINEAVR